MPFILSHACDIVPVKMNWPKKTDLWVSKELISKAQGEKIVQFEMNSRTGVSQRSLFLLGFTVIAIGVISLIAANWDDIPHWAKLGVDFILMGVLAWYLGEIFKRENAILFDGALAFYILFILASIGLISQIYQLHGDLIDAIRFWFFIVLPISLFARSPAVPHLMVLSLLWICGDWMMDFFSLDRFGRNGVNVEFLFLPVLLGVLHQISSLVKGGEPFQKALISWLTALFICGTAWGDFRIAATRQWTEGSLNFTYPPFFLILIASLVLVWVLFLMFLSKHSSKNKMGILSMMALYAIMYVPKIQALDSQLLGAFLLLAGWALLAWYFALMHQPRLFQQMILLIGIRFLVIYFQVFGTLTTTGIGLIVSGLLIVGATLLWIKYQKKIYQLAEGKGT